MHNFFLSSSTICPMHHHTSLSLLAWIVVCMKILRHATTAKCFKLSIGGINVIGMVRAIILRVNTPDCQQWYAKGRECHLPNQIGRWKGDLCCTTYTRTHTRITRISYAHAHATLKRIRVKSATVANSSSTHKMHKKKIVSSTRLCV